MDVKNYLVKESLHDGSPVIVRAIRPADKSDLQEALAGLSHESAYSRFFYSKRKLSKSELKALTEIDFELQAAIGVGLVENEEMLPIGIGRYIVDPSDPHRAEVAFTVADEFQGVGVGSLLLKHLVIIALEKGIVEFFATTISGNQKMLRVFRRSQIPMQTRVVDGVAEVTLSLKNTS